MTRDAGGEGKEWVSPSEAGLELEISADTVVRYVKQGWLYGWQAAPNCQYHISIVSVRKMKRNRERWEAME